LEDVTKGRMVPLFNAGFEIFEVLLKLEHLGTWRRNESPPSGVNHFLEAWVGERESLKLEGYFDVVPWSGPL
jgi:hypothetical protein